MQLYRLLRKVVRILRRKGASHLIRRFFHYIVRKTATSFLAYGYYKAFRSGTFTFRGRDYNYFFHMYNTTWRNERAVEIPIVWETVKGYRGKHVLEVGNVLSHYFPVEHEILDKYEKAPGVINLDVTDFSPSKKYDLIVSISTLEHVGLYEKPWKQGKILQVLKNLERCSTLRGCILITLPFGYNQEVDKLLEEGKIRFTEQYYLKRISPSNRWIEVRCDNVRDIKYDTTYPTANAIVIGIIEKQYRRSTPLNSL